MGCGETFNTQHSTPNVEGCSFRRQFKNFKWQISHDPEKEQKDEGYPGPARLGARGNGFRDFATDHSADADYRHDWQGQYEQLIETEGGDYLAMQEMVRRPQSTAPGALQTGYAVENAHGIETVMRGVEAEQQYENRQQGDSENEPNPAMPT